MRSQKSSGRWFELTVPGYARPDGLWQSLLEAFNHAMLQTIAGSDLLARILERPWP